MTGETALLFCIVIVVIVQYHLLKFNKVIDTDINELIKILSFGLIQRTVLRKSG
jgi:hypothetical protein